MSRSCHREGFQVSEATEEAVRLCPGFPFAGDSSSSSFSLLSDAAKETKGTRVGSSFRRRKALKPVVTRKRKLGSRLCSSRFKKRMAAAAALSKTHLRNRILGRRRALLLEAGKRSLALRLKHLADTVEAVKRELQPVKEETELALDQLLSIQGMDDNGDASRIINNGSLEEKFRSLLEKCAMREEEILKTTKAIQEKMQEI